MKTSKNNLIAILTIGAAVLAASSASAGGFSFGGGGGGGGGNNGNKSSFNINFSGGNNHNSSSYNKKYSSCHDSYYHVRYIEPVRLVYSQCYHPQFQCCFVFPGDTWYSISKRNYGVDFLCRHIASFNGLSMNSLLVPGQMLRLPVVNSNGSLAVSNAPMPAPFAPQGIPFAAQGSPIGPQGLPNGLIPQGSPAGLAPQGMPNGSAPQSLPNGVNTGAIGPQGQSIVPMQNAVTTPNVQPSATVTPAANIRTVTEEPTLPRVAIGSTLELDGESLGTEKGIVRLRVNGIALPVDVIEWTTGSVKIQLPKMDVTSPVKAELEVLRVDGSLASNSTIELTPAATRLALGN